jgi:hypothetical protein
MAGEACPGEGRGPAIYDFLAARCKVVDGAPPPSRTMTQERQCRVQLIRLFPHED